MARRAHCQVSVVALLAVGLVAGVLLPCYTTRSALSSPWDSEVDGIAKLSYDELCDAMVTTAQAVAVAHNGGDVEKAALLSQRVHRLFDVAVAAQPKAVQAYLNLAVFLSNTHAYERAVALFNDVKGLLGDGEGELAAMIDSRIRDTQFSMYSMKRDMAYAGGTGNVIEAHHWAELQRSTANLVRLDAIYHDLGTLEVMLCEYSKPYCASALEQFHSAAQVAQQKYSMAVVYGLGVSPSKKVRMRADRCMNSSFRFADWSGLPSGMVKIRRQDDMALNALQIPSEVWGRDGVVTLRTHEVCDRLAVEADPLSSSMRYVQPPTKQSPVVVHRALTLVQFSADAFYHWMCEVLPRLSVARRMMSAAELAGVTLLLPVDPTTSLVPAFVNDTFEELFRGVFFDNNRRVPHVQRTRVTGELFAVTWPLQGCPAVEGESQSASPSSSGNACISLAEPQALRFAREDIHAALDAQGLPSARITASTGASELSRYTVILSARGSGTTMRNYDEPALLKALQSRLSGLNVEVVLFESARYSLTSALRLFRSAVAVVGVHGASLSNMVACEEHTSVLEIGFTTIGAQHYAHVAHALRLDYHRVLVAKDAGHRAIAAPYIEFDVDEVARVLRQCVEQQINRLQGSFQEGRETADHAETRSDL